MGDITQDTQELIAQEAATNSATNSNLCKEYLKYMQYNVPLPRYTPVSPYGKSQSYTKYDLDMRRKAEVLKYRSLASQDNGTTKTQKLAFLFNNVTRLKHIIDRSQACENIVSSSTACDVPGPPVNLYLDEKVPLYNYIKTYTFGDFSDTVGILNWSTDTDEDLPFDNGKADILFSIIYNNTKSGFTTYSFKSPVAIFIEGTKNPSPPPGATPVKRISVQIIKINVLVLYADNYIKFLTLPVLTRPNPSILEIELANDATDFTASKYIGAISVSNLKLITQYQYVYDISLKFTLKTTLYDSTGSVISGQSDTTVTGSIIANLGKTAEDTFNLYEDGCTITNPALPAPVPFNVTSVPPNTVYNI
jgi:hypothetical protein